MTEPIYLDYAATTPTDADALSSALPYYTDAFYNPSSGHALGMRAASAVECARAECARAINCKPSEIFFTSGATEAVNWVINKLVKYERGRFRIVVSGLEHDCVFECVEDLHKIWFDVATVQPDADGIVRPEALERVVNENTALVCVMTVNNIIGTVQPIKELARVAHAVGADFFTDAVQAVNTQKIDVRDSDVDFLAVSGHKFYAPKGCGFLYMKSGAGLHPFVLGGGQERGMRAGTVDVPAVVAMGKAITKAAAMRDEYVEHAKKVSEAFAGALEFGHIIAENSPRTPDILSVAFDGADGGRLAVALSMAGVCCSVGSACSAGSATPPQTLLNMGFESARSSVRFSFGRQTTEKQAKAAAEIVNATVKRLLGK